VPDCPRRATRHRAVIYGICGPSICKVDAASGKKRTLLKGTASKPYTSVSASRSGAKLAFIRAEEVFRAKQDGKSPERIGTALRQAAPEVNVRPDGGAVAKSVATDPARWLDDPAGSADGKRVAAVARRGSAGAPGSVSGPIALFDAASGARISDLTKGADLDPAFSPDAKRVAFVRGRDLYAVPAGGGSAKRLAKNVSSPSWAQR
jgi:hypothetical protein